jgi:hypothetical protein
MPLDKTSTPGEGGTDTAGESITLSAAFAPVTLRVQPATLKEYTFGYKRVKFDATPYNYARFSVDVKTAGATNAAVQLYYSVTGATGTFVSAGLTSPIRCGIGTAGIQVGGGYLVAEARADVYWAAQFIDGNGAASPCLGLVAVQFLLTRVVTTQPETLYIRHSAPSAKSCLALYNGGWTDIFGVNSGETLGVVHEDLQFATVLTTKEADDAAWVTGAAGLGGWSGGSDDEGNPAVLNTGAILLKCLTSSQSKTITFTLPAYTDPCSKGLHLRAKMRNQGGTWTVVGFPGQCAGNETTCGIGVLCCHPVNMKLEMTGAFGGVCVSSQVVQYWSNYRLSSPWGSMRFALPAGASGTVTLEYILGPSCTPGPHGVGYGSFATSFSHVLLYEPPTDRLTFSRTKGSSVKTIKPETDFDAKRASGGFSRVYGAPLAAQTIPAWTYQLRVAAGLTPGVRYAQGHLKARLWVWRPTGDVDVGTIGTVSSPTLTDGTIREYDLALTGSALAVQAGDRLVLDFSASLDTPATTTTYPITPKPTEGAAPYVQYDGTDDSFSTGSAPAVGGAASHITVPGLTYTGAAA